MRILNICEPRILIVSSLRKASKHDIDLAKKIKISFELRNEGPDTVLPQLGTSYCIENKELIENIPIMIYEKALFLMIKFKKNLMLHNFDIITGNIKLFNYFTKDACF